MPYKLRKAPKRELYWVVTKGTNEKHSKEPLPRERAEAQMRALYSAMKGKGRFFNRGKVAPAPVLWTAPDGAVYDLRQQPDPSRPGMVTREPIMISPPRRIELPEPSVLPVDPAIPPPPKRPVRSREAEERYQRQDESNKIRIDREAEERYQRRLAEYREKYKLTAKGISKKGGASTRKAAFGEWFVVDAFGNPVAVYTNEKAALEHAKYLTDAEKRFPPSPPREGIRRRRNSGDTIDGSGFFKDEARRIFDQEVAGKNLTPAKRRRAENILQRAQYKIKQQPFSLKREFPTRQALEDRIAEQTAIADDPYHSFQIQAINALPSLGRSLETRDTKQKILDTLRRQLHVYLTGEDVAIPLPYPTRRIPEGSTEAITFDTIEHGDVMSDIVGPSGSDFPHERYYSSATSGRLDQNPFTRERILRRDPYIARTSNARLPQEAPPLPLGRIKTTRKYGPVSKYLLNPIKNLFVTPRTEDVEEEDEMVQTQNPLHRGGRVCMPKKDYVKEHERLIKVLTKGKKSELLREAKSQSKELGRKVRGKKKA